MPQPISNDAVFELSLVGRHAGQRTLTVLHYKTRSIVGVMDFNARVADLQTGIMGLGGLVEAYLNCCSEEYEMEATRWQVLSPNRFAYHLFPLTGAVGAIAGAALPPNDGGVLVKRNDATGRRNRGIVHMPALPVAWADEGFLTSAAITAYQQLGDELVIPLDLPQSPDPTAFADPVIFNRTVPALSPPYLSAIPQNTARVNRRRTVGVGE